MSLIKVIRIFMQSILIKERFFIFFLFCVCVCFFPSLAMARAISRRNLYKFGSSQTKTGPNASKTQIFFFWLYFLLFYIECNNLCIALFFKFAVDFDPLINSGLPQIQARYSCPFFVFGISTFVF